MMSTETAPAGAKALAAAVRSGRIRAMDVVDAALSRIEALSELNAFTSVVAKRARAQAKQVDATVSAGGDPGPFAGVPFAAKDLFDIQGTVTLAGSALLRSQAPAAEDATLVARLTAAGGLCVGALNMGEFAYDFVTENVHYGATRNPHDRRRSAGGSSGGSGAAVAAGLVPVALGTDTNGSIRVPSSFCGIWGLKPTYGRLSRAGAFPFVASLDHVGPFARSVADLALAYDLMQGPDPRDPAQADRGVEPSLPGLERGCEGLRVGLLGGYFGGGGASEVHAAATKVAQSLGASEVVELPMVEKARAAAFLITACEGGQLHLPRLRASMDAFDPAARDRLLAGALLPSAWYLQAQRFRAYWRDLVRPILQRFDVLVAPATPVVATLLGQESLEFGGRSLPVRPNLGIFTQPISFIGLPVVAAPVAAVSGRLPTAVQLIGSPWTESLLLRAARRLEVLGVCSAPVPNPS